MDSAGIAAALLAEVENEEGLLATEQERRRSHPHPTTAADSEEDTPLCCHRCRLPVRHAGFLREDAPAVASPEVDGGDETGAPSSSSSFSPSTLLAVWWCEGCSIAFDGAGIRAPESGPAPLVPGYVWYGRWRFYPSPITAAIVPAASNPSAEDTLCAAEAVANECAHLLSLARSAAQSGDRRDQAHRLRQFRTHLAQLAALAERLDTPDTDLG